MYDNIEVLAHSLIQHGKENDRIYLMKLNSADYSGILPKLEEIAKKNNYSKIFAKVNADYSEEFINNGYGIEAVVPGFYNGKKDGLFLGKYYSEDRKNIAKDLQIEIDKNIDLAESKAGSKKPGSLPNEYYIRKLNDTDLDQLAELYKIVFPSYPFPIHETNFLKEVMEDNVEFFGVLRKKDERLVAASSAEKYEDYSNAEMTDFATHPDALGKGLALFLLDVMEEEMAKQGFKTLYTIARSHSAGMNITFSKNDYIFAGTLKNNTNIFGRIESMNIWYKKM
ncbi:MAG: putative beta-lysine N-acetyltransferase [Candidatus Kapabacteria bacterium]|jgi:putative beta-lysine N-acetyltransferase|nr:putative beta-lysine N-acetyltransferase [Candidatus Kapabacteria bacterium]